MSKKKAGNKTQANSTKHKQAKIRYWTTEIGVDDMPQWKARLLETLVRTLQMSLLDLDLVVAAAKEARFRDKELSTRTEKGQIAYLNKQLELMRYK